MERIQEVNDTLHVVTEINPDALDIAASLDEQRARGVIKGFVTRRLGLVRKG